MQDRSPERPLWLSKISLRDFRCFEKFDLDLPREAVVFIGPNASGKTSLLTAIAAILGLAGLHVGAQGIDVPLSELDYRGMIRRSGSSYVIERSDSAKIEGMFEAVSDLDYFRTHDFRFQSSASGWVWSGHQVPPKRPSKLPLLRWIPSPRAFDDTSTDNALANEFAAAPDRVASPWGNRLPGVGRITARLAQLALTRDGGPPLLEEELLDNLVRLLWPEFGGIRYQGGHREAILRTADEESGAPLRQMSAGQRSLLSIGFDLALRAMNLNGHLGAEALQLTPGVVLIDELDEHLHPGMAKHALPALMAAFPLVQFIVASHSPQVWGTAPNGSLIALVNESGSIRPRTINFSDGADSAFLLESVFDIAERPSSALTTELARYRGLLEATPLDREALAVAWHSLDARLDPDDPERVRLTGARKLAEYRNRAS